ncbi:TPA: hypothetical protein ACFNMH_001590 [Neisseria elongata]
MSLVVNYDTLDQLVCFTDCTGETTRFGYTEYGDLSRRQSRNLRIRPPQPADRPHRRTRCQNRL